MVPPHTVATGWGSSGSSLGYVLDTQSGIARCTPGGLGGAPLDFPPRINFVQLSFYRFLVSIETTGSFYFFFFVSIGIRY